MKYFLSFVVTNNVISFALDFFSVHDHNPNNTMTIANDLKYFMFEFIPFGV